MQQTNFIIHGVGSVVEMRVNRNSELEDKLPILNREKIH